MFRMLITCNNFLISSININTLYRRANVKYFCTAGFKQGLWSYDEDAALFKGVKTFTIPGKKGKPDRIAWKEVSRFLDDRRSTTQCANRWAHLTKYQYHESLKCGRWSPEEDAKLIAAVKKYSEEGKDGRIAWTKVSELVGGRNGDQCRRRWVASVQYFVNGKPPRAKWTPAEDVILEKVIERYSREGAHGGKLWNKAASYFNNTKTHAQCYNRWRFLITSKGKHKSAPWTPEEDEKLTDAVRKLEIESQQLVVEWDKVSMYMNETRSASQCRFRWRFLNKEEHISKIFVTWSQEETKRLEEAVKLYTKTSNLKGKALWKKVSEHMDGERSANACVARWYGLKKIKSIS